MTRRGDAGRVGPPVEGRPTGRWDPETFMCAFRGHRVPAIEAGILRPDDWLVGMEAPDGGHLGRCLRCDAWVLADPAAATASDLGAVTVEVPERGKKLRDSLVLKLIAVDRGLHCVVFSLLALGLLVLWLDLGSLQDQARELVSKADSGLAGTGQGSSRGFLLRQLDRVVGLNPGTLRILLISAVAYAVVEGVEAVGLWRGRRWAEYLTAVATAGFLPLEIDELMNKVSVGRVLALVVNLAVLVYLIWKKHLFGVAGGVAEEDTELALGDRLPVLPGQRNPAVGGA